MSTSKLESTQGGDGSGWLLDRWQECIENYVERESEVLKDSRPTSRQDMSATIESARTARNVQLMGLTTVRMRQDPLVAYLWSALIGHDRLMDRLLSAQPETFIPQQELNDTHKLLAETLTRHIREVQRTRKSWDRTIASFYVLALIVAAIGLYGWRISVDSPNNNLLIAVSVSAIILGLIGAAVATRLFVNQPPWVATILIVLPSGFTFVAVLQFAYENRMSPTSSIGAAAAGLALVSVLAYLLFVSAPGRVLRADSGGRLPHRRWSVVQVVGGGVRAELEDLGGEAAKKADVESRSASRWRVAHYVLGGSAALTAGASSLDGVGPQFAIVAAGLAALVTALNPAQRAGEKQTVADGCASLGREIGVMARIDLENYLSEPTHELMEREALEDVLDRYDATLGAPERKSFWSRRLQHAGR
jgi:hypothetical protein